MMDVEAWDGVLRIAARGVVALSDTGRRILAEAVAKAHDAEVAGLRERIAASDPQSARLPRCPANPADAQGHSSEHGEAAPGAASFTNP